MKAKRFKPNEITTERILRGDVNPATLKINSQSPSLRKRLDVKPPKISPDSYKSNSTIYRP